MVRVQGRPPAASVIGALAAAAVFLVGGCWGGPPKPQKEAVAYDGPSVTLESLAGQHVVVLHAPTGGWSFTFDRDLETLRGRDVFVTATRPNPAYMHTQAIVEQRLGTRIDARTPVEVYIRVLDHGAEGDSAGYRLAARSPAG